LTTSFQKNIDYFANFGVCSWGSFGQIKSKGAVHIMFFKKAVNCELAVPVPNLLAMCAQTRYILCEV
jgi:hypothetical protein